MSITAIVKLLEYGPKENVNLILSQKLAYVATGKADLTAIVIPNQLDRPFLPVLDSNAALSVDISLPEANTLEGLLPLKQEPPRWGGYVTLKLCQSSMVIQARTWRS